MEGSSGCSVKTLAAVLIVAGVVAFLSRGLVARVLLGRAFPLEVLREYQEMCIQKGCRDVGTEGKLSRTGKVVMLVPSRKKTGITSYYVTDHRSQAAGGGESELPRLDRDFFSLPSNIRASSSQEVDTVIICERDTKTVGYYSAGGTGFGVDTVLDAGFQKVVTIKAYDLGTGRFLGASTHLGPMPKKEIHKGERQSGVEVDLAPVITSMPLE